MLLAIDTATHLAAIALHDAHGVTAHHQWHTERNHTVELLPNIITMLADQHVEARTIQAIAVASGPGSYTGLRIGLSVAKGFCLAHGATLISVPTLEISAQTYPVRAGVLCAILQAGRGRLGAQFYVPEAGHWQANGTHFLGKADELVGACRAYLEQPTEFVGEIDALTESVLREQLGTRATFAPQTERARDPRVLARLGWARWQRGECVDVATFAPFYG